MRGPYLAQQVQVVLGMKTITSLTPSSPGRGDLLTQTTSVVTEFASQIVATIHGHYVGERDGQTWIAWEGLDFSAMCEAFDAN